MPGAPAIASLVGGGLGAPCLTAECQATLQTDRTTSYRTRCRVHNMLARKMLAGTSNIVSQLAKALSLC